MNYDTLTIIDLHLLVIKRITKKLKPSASMASTSSYQVLLNEPDEVDDVPLPPTTTSTTTDAVEPTPAILEVAAISPPVASLPPPPYVVDGSTVVGSSTEPSHELPPQYVDIVKLPTYNESEQLLDDEESDEQQHANNRYLFWFLRPDSLSRGAGAESGGFHELGSETGSDAAFMFSFLLALIFNWLGFLVSYCFTRSLAAYYGAISGFGMSLVKWAFIAQHSEWSRDFMVENPWFCYAFVLFGWVIFMRGVFAYIQMKRMAYRTGAAASESTGAHPACTMFG